MRDKSKIQLKRNEKRQLVKIVKKRKTPFDIVIRAKIILMTAKKYSDTEIARRLGICRTTVIKWQERWTELSTRKMKAFNRLQDTLRSGTPAKFQPEHICQLISIACVVPMENNRPISHWTARELADELIKQGVVDSISPRQVGRILDEADLKPHKIRYYLHTEKNEEFDVKSKNICNLYLEALELSKNGERIISCDEKTGIQALERTAANKPMEPGRIERHEFNYDRHGTLCLIANFDVVTGEVVNPTIDPTRNEQDFLEHIKRILLSDSTAKRWNFIVDNLNIHFSEALVKLVGNIEGISDIELGKKGKSGILKSQRSREEFLANKKHKVVFHYTPKHSSWLNQVEIWFSILVKKLLKRSSFKSLEDLKDRILAFIKYFNETMAKPFKWTYKGRVLKGI